MKFESLTIRNFLTIGEATLSLADKGLVLVQGVNEDDGSANSNGAGKSSVADALSWVLFGVTARGVSGDSVVNKTAKKECAVQVTFSDGATKYSVTRYRKHKEGKNSLKVEAVDSGVTDLSKGTDKETQEVLERIIGCSYDVFKAAVYCGQEQMPDLPGLTDKNLKILIEEAAGIERIQRAYDIAREYLRTAEGDHAGIVNQLASTRLFVESQESTLRQIDADEKKWQTEQVTRIAAAEEVYKAACNDFTTLANALKGSDRPGLVKQRDEKKEALQGYEKTQADLKALRAQIVATGRKLQTVEFDLRQKAAERTAAQNAIDNVDVEMARPCAACGKPHTPEEKQAYLDHQAKRLCDVIVAAKPVGVLYKAIKAELDELQKQEQTLQAVPAPTELLKEIAALDQQILDLDRRIGQLRQFKDTVQRAGDQVTEIRGQWFPMSGTRVAVEKKLEEGRANQAALDLLAIKAREGVDLAGAAVKVFGPAGVRAHILDTVTPFLNDRTAEYLSLLSDGNITAVWSTLARNKAGELKEKFCIEVANKTGADSFAGLSGGEKRKVRLGCMLALQDLVASRAVKPIDLFVADEIDDALDDSGLERLMTVLDRRAKERGTVLVVSHNSLADWCDSVATVTKSGGYAKVEGALC